jgi:hypothetical protein
LFLDSNLRSAGALCLRTKCAEVETFDASDNSGLGHETVSRLVRACAMRLHIMLASSSQDAGSVGHSALHCHAAGDAGAVPSAAIPPTRTRCRPVPARGRGSLEPPGGDTARSPMAGNAQAVCGRPAWPYGIERARQSWLSGALSVRLLFGCRLSTPVFLESQLRFGHLRYWVLLARSLQESCLSSGGTYR